MASPKERSNVLDHFLWNCSVIKGQRDLLFSCHQRAEEILNDLWVACVRYGLAEEQVSDDKQSAYEANTSSLNSNNNTNKNNNNLVYNGGNPMDGASLKPPREKAKYPGEMLRSKSFFSKPRKQSKTFFRSSSDEGFPVTTV